MSTGPFLHSLYFLENGFFISGNLNADDVDGTGFAYSLSNWANLKISLESTAGFSNLPSIISDLTFPVDHATDSYAIGALSLHIFQNMCSLIFEKLLATIIGATFPIPFKQYQKCWLFVNSERYLKTKKYNLKQIYISQFDKITHYNPLMEFSKWVIMGYKK